MKKKKKRNRPSLLPGIKIIARRLSVYKKPLVVASILSIFAALASALVPLVSGRLLDALINPREVELFGKLVFVHIVLLVIWVTVQLVMHVLNWNNRMRSESLGMRIYLDYISDGFTHLLETPISFHKDNKLGEVQERLQKAGSDLYDIASSIIINLAPEFLSIIIAVGISFFVNKLLAIFLLAGVSIYIIVMLFIVRPMSDLQRSRNKAFRKAWGVTWDALHNVQAVKQSTTEIKEKSKVKKAFIGGALSAWIKIFRLWQNLSFAQRVIILLTQLGIYVFSIQAILADTMTVGELVMFNGYAALVFGPFVILANNWQAIQTGIIAIEEGEKIMLHPKEAYNRGEYKDVEFIGNVEFKNVFFKYPKGKTVLKDINFEAKSGQTIALVGESGVGKSTLVDLISAYYYPTEGSVEIDGIDTRNHDLHRLRNNIGVVSQEVVLFHDSIYKNIKYGNSRANKSEIEKAAKLANATEFINKFPKKWKQVVGERGIKLSVGQKQRVAIARAILRNPKILILDEPTSALDAKSEKKIQKALDYLMKGKTTFVIAHRLSTVRSADTILVFEKGQIAERGTHNQLMKIKGGVYRRLYELQIGLEND